MTKSKTVLLAGLLSAAVVIPAVIHHHQEALLADVVIETFQQHTAVAHPVSNLRAQKEELAQLRREVELLRETVERQNQIVASRVAGIPPSQTGATASQQP